METDQVPVLVLGFNRPKMIEQLFRALEKIKPKMIYFAVDGPRSSNLTDLDLVTEVQRMVSIIDWECQINTLFRAQNLGLKKSVIEAIDWIFENEEVAIILEDDCIPSIEFFGFCAEELERHKNISRLMQISGNCFVPISNLNSDRYYYSTINDIWGWATWKRAWNLFEREVPSIESEELKKRLLNYFPNREISRWFFRYIQEASAPDSQVWSTQWTLALINNNGLTIVPQKNLVRNIGFVADATHMTSEAFDIYGSFECGEIQSKTIPAVIEANRDLDLQRFSIIKATDLNLRVSSLLMSYARTFTKRILPPWAINLIRRIKNQ